jgi:hypothetical protein
MNILLCLFIIIMGVIGFTFFGILSVIDFIVGEEWESLNVD